MLGDLFRPPSRPPGTPTVTFVCTGNICRSALAEKLLRRQLAVPPTAPAITVESAGMRAVVGSGMDTVPASIAVRNGADPTHVARQLNRPMVDSSTLILTMTKDQRRELVEEFPSALKRTFTFVEFVRILAELPDAVAGLDPAAGRELFDVVLDASRHRSAVIPAAEDDIDDPYRRSVETHERVGGRIVGLVAALDSSIHPR